MVGLTMLVASIGLADSINPSTLIPALWLAGGPRARGIAWYALGVFAVYLAGGLVLVFGPGPSLLAAFHRVGGSAEHVVELAGGAVVLGVAIALWRSRHNERRESHPRRCSSRASAFALGAGIMAVELPTAFMYFGAISAIIAARLEAPADVVLLTVYNALFVAPVVAVLAVRRLAGGRGDQWIATAEARLAKLGQLTLACAAGVAGSVLLAVGMAGLLGAS